MIKSLICWFKGHVQAYEAVEIDGHTLRAGYCSRCGCGMFTFEPPIVVPPHSSISIPMTIVGRE